MGIIYYAVNTEKGKAYELGKGAWPVLLDCRSECVDVTNTDRLTRTILEKVMVGWAEEVTRDDSYARSIAQDLDAIGPKIEIRDDSSWDDPLEGLELVGTRYRE